MIEIANTELWGKILTEELVSVDNNRSLTSLEKISFINALAKASARVESSGAFMDFDADADKLLIWSDSNQIYEVNGTKSCQCRAFLNGKVCWHRAAKHIISRYVLADKLETCMATLGGSC
jgi:hypothetical protein